MKSSKYHILLTLADGPLHGAEIRRRAEEESGGAVTLYPATLYGSLDGLQETGKIRQVEVESAEPDRARWRFYTLTAEGRAALEAETNRLEAVVGRARALLGGTTGG